MTAKTYKSSDWPYRDFILLTFLTNTLILYACACVCENAIFLRSFEIISKTTAKRRCNFGIHASTHGNERKRDERLANAILPGYKSRHHFSFVTPRSVYLSLRTIDMALQLNAEGRKKAVHNRRANSPRCCGCCCFFFFCFFFFSSS